MQRRLGCFLLAGLMVVCTGERPALAQAKFEAPQGQSIKVKEMIASLGTGEAAQIGVTLLDRSFRSGYVSEVGDDSFIVTNPLNETHVEVGYNEVARLG